MDDRQTTWIGGDWLRPDAESKVRGEAKYVDDLSVPGMLHGWIVRSPHPHARIQGIDVSAALARPDVMAVVTHKDIPGANVIHVIYDDQPALAVDTVRYVGEPVALVAATSRAAARAAASLVELTYEPLPGVFHPIDALAANAPRVVSLPDAAEGGGNLFNEMVLCKGDVEMGFREADIVIEGQYETGYQEHAYIEPQGALAVPENGGMTVIASMQCPFYVQSAVAKVLALPLSKIRVVQAVTGGAFGGKEDVPSQISSLAALLAWRSRHPVKLVLSRDEDILTTSKRHPSSVRYRTAARRDGTITAVDVDIVLNAGAYQTLSSAVLWRSLCTAAGPYRVPHVHVRARSVATHTVPNGAFRGFGSPQVILPHEAQLDRLAAALDVDRIALRRKNLLIVGDTTSTGQRLPNSVGALQALDRARTLTDWDGRLQSIASFNASQDHLRRGLGVACVMYGVGLGGKAPFLDKAAATMKLEADGSVSLAVGTVEMGQGLTTALLQIAAEGLGIPMDRLQIAPVDTSRVPDSGPTVASRGTIMSGLAILDAAARLLERMAHVAEAMGIPTDNVTNHWDEIAKYFWLENLAPSVEGWAATEPVSWDPKTGLGDAYAVYAYATHISEVEVDTDTGEVDIVDYVAVHDSGRILNRGLATGQVHGGIAQGIGFALMEEIVQKQGVLQVNGFTTYRLPTLRDVPSNPRVEFIEALFPAGPFGAKGIGEVPLMASHAAIAGAVAHATGGQVSRYPLDPATVRTMLFMKQGKG